MFEKLTEEEKIAVVNCISYHIYNLGEKIKELEDLFNDSEIEGYKDLILKNQKELEKYQAIYKKI